MYNSHISKAGKVGIIVWGTNRTEPKTISAFFEKFKDAVKILIKKDFASEFNIFSYFISPHHFFKYAQSGKLLKESTDYEKLAGEAMNLQISNDD